MALVMAETTHVSHTLTPEKERVCRCHNGDDKLRFCTRSDKSGHITTIQTRWQTDDTSATPATFANELALHSTRVKEDDYIREWREEKVRGFCFVNDVHLADKVSHNKILRFLFSRQREDPSSTSGKTESFWFIAPGLIGYRFSCRLQNVIFPPPRLCLFL